jgi:L-arabinose isomerase
VSEFSNLRVGLLGVGLRAYWSQFDGLEERLRGYVQTVEGRLRGPGRHIINFDLVDSPERALAVGHEARAHDVDILVIYVTTYTLSSTILPIVRRAKVPVLVLNLQPTAALDYAAFNALPDRTAMTGEWLAYCSACPMPEIANVFARCGIPFHQVIGTLEKDDACWHEIDEWMEAARVAHLSRKTEKGPILPIGNTNSRYRFPIGAHEFLERWNSNAPAHHCAVGVGHLAGKLAKLGALLGIDTTQVC